MDKMISIDEFQQLAHEVKNPLTICKGYLEMLLKDKDNNKYFEIIKKEIDRSIMILTDYMVLNKEKVDLINLLEDIVDLLNPFFIKHNSRIILLPNNCHYYIEGDYNHLKRMIINLLKNAYEAKDVDKLLVVIDIIERDDTYCLIITDNGCGMDSEVEKKMREKYYTTKKNGNGLGFNCIMDNVLEHGGDIKYYSKKGLGTRIEVSIPKKSPRTFNNSNYCWNK